MVGRFRKILLVSGYSAASIFRTPTFSGNSASNFQPTEETCSLYLQGSFLFSFLGWGETESTICPTGPVPEDDDDDDDDDDDKRGAVVGMLGREVQVLGVDLPQCRFVHHKSHMT
jgi:hypothetical protein